MKLYDYQLAGVKFLRNNSRCILGDQMGLGKTPQVLMALTADHYPVVVVCPASVRMVWEQEAAKWNPEDTTQVIRTGKDKSTGADITIISYDLFGKVKMKRPRTMVVDEAHYCQSRKTRRTKTISSASHGMNLWLLTGTPLWSRPRSLFPLLDMVGGWSGSYNEYAKRFCNAGYVMKPIRGRGYTRVWEDSGASNLDELADVLRPHIMRRLKAEVLKELPLKTRQIITLPSRISEAERKLGKFDFNSLKGGQIPPGPTATAIKDTALGKLKAINDHVETLLRSERKIIIFAWNREVMDRIEDANQSYGIARIDGSVSQDDRVTAVTEFQSDAERTPRIFLGQTVAAGTGLTLTAASVVVFAQPCWTPAELEQAEDRAHRIGQTSNVLIQYLVTEGSIEQVMLTNVLSKMGVAKKILD